MKENNSLDILKATFEKILPSKDKREKIGSVEFIINLIFCYFPDSKTSSLESIRKAMKSILKIEIKRNSFWERLAGNRLKIYLKAIVAELMGKFSSNILEKKDALNKLGVKSIWIIDSSTITLKDNAEKRFPGTGSKAGIKWHACFNAFSGVMEWFQLTPSSTNDRKCFPDVALLKNKLILSDLGYFDYGLLLSIKEVGGFFLTRLKSNSVVHVTKGVLGFPKKAVGKSLLSFHFKGEKEAIVEALIKKVYGKKTLECRAIGFWNPLDKKYHWYLTNLVVAASIIYPLYRVRWQIELIFKACKSSLNANQIPSSNENIIESLLLASIASYLSTYTLLDNSLPYLDDQQKQAISF